MPREKKVEVMKEESVPVKKALLDRLIKILNLVFLIIWIPVGTVFLLSIYANFRQGAYSGILSPPAQSQNQQASAPTEADLPGVGLVNVNCVQSALSSDAIQKIVTEGNTNSLTEEEKTKLEACKVQTPAATPTPTS